MRRSVLVRSGGICDSASYSLACSAVSPKECTNGCANRRLTSSRRVSTANGFLRRDFLFSFAIDVRVREHARFSRSERALEHVCLARSEGFSH